MKKSDIAYMSREELIAFIKEYWTDLPRLYGNRAQELFFNHRETCELRELSLSLCDD